MQHTTIVAVALAGLVALSGVAVAVPDQADSAADNTDEHADDAAVDEHPNEHAADENASADEYAEGVDAPG